MATYPGLEEEELIPTVELPEALPAAGKKMTWQRGPLAVLFTSHMLDDISQGAIPALLPYFVQKHHLSYASAAALVMAANVPSAFLQPLFGRISDRRPSAWMMPAGMVVAMLGVALATLMPTYGLIVACMVLSGIGVAAYHPEASRAVYRISGNQPSTGMSIFGLGSAAGFAVSPMLMTGVMLVFGYRGTLLLLIPVGIMAAIMIRWLGRLAWTRDGTEHGHSDAHSTRRDQWWNFVRLNLVMVTRSLTFYGVMTFLPLYWIANLHQSKIAASTALSLFLAGGAAGTLLGGRIADKWNPRIVVVWGIILVLPGLALLALLHRVGSANLNVAVMGLIMFSYYSPMVVLSFRYLPNHLALASGITIGFTTNIGGMLVPLMGWAADRWGLHFALMLLLAVPVPGWLMALSLPKEPAQSRAVTAA